MTNARRGRVPQHRIGETVAAELRARILAGDGPDGYRLPTQDQLVGEFGVSYPSIREAIRILETEGLVTVRRGNVGGAEVHRPDESSAAYHLGLALQARQVTLGDLAAGLRLLEPLCAAECARRADRAETVVPELTASIEKSAGLTDDGAGFTRVAREFHDILVAFTPNATVRHVVGSLVALWSAQEQAWAEAMTRRGDYPAAAEAAAAVGVHRRIAGEIAAGQDAAAERVARAHLAATQAMVLERFDEGIVTVSSAQARQAIESGRAGRLAGPALHDDGADAFRAVHEIDAFVDLVERDALGHHGGQVQRPASASPMNRGKSRRICAPPAGAPDRRLPENTAWMAGRVSLSVTAGMPRSVTLPAVRAISKAWTMSSGRPTTSKE